MPKLFKNVRSGFDLVPPGWKHVSVDEALIKDIKSGKSVGQPRLAIRLNIIGPDAVGRKLFAGGQLTGDYAGIARAQVEALNPDVDWGDFDFPDNENDTRKNKKLNETLKDCEAYALVVHKTRDGEERAEVSRIVDLDNRPAELGDDEDEDEEYDDTEDEEEEDEDEDADDEEEDLEDDDESDEDEDDEEDEDEEDDEEDDEDEEEAPPAKPASKSAAKSATKTAPRSRR